MKAEKYLQELIEQEQDYLSGYDDDEKPEVHVQRLNDLKEALAEVKNCSIPDVVWQSEQLKAFSDFAQKRMWEDGDKDLSEFVDEFLSL